MSCPMGDTSEVDAELAVACGGGGNEEGVMGLGNEEGVVGLGNEAGVVGLATLALSITIGSEWPSVVAAGIPEDFDQMTSRMTSK